MRTGNFEGKGVKYADSLHLLKYACMYFSKASKSNLKKGRIAAAHGWFIRIRRVTPTFTSIY